MSKTSHKTRDMAYIGLFAVLITLCSWIAIPTAVPFTLHTLGVFLSCLILGGKRGTLTVFVYILLGVTGMPVFPVCYGVGTVWFRVLYMQNTGMVGWTAVLSCCVFPFIVPDFIKMAAALLVAKRLRPVIKMT